MGTKRIRKPFHAFWEIQNVRQLCGMWRLLSHESLVVLVMAFVLSWLDYCNAVLSNLPKNLLDWFQFILKVVAHMISAHCYDHVTLLLEHLHWLPVHEHIGYKLCSRIGAPAYLACDLQPLSDVESWQWLHLAATSTLLVPRMHRTMGDQSFPVAMTPAWNALTSSVTSVPSLTTFCQSLKIHLFRCA